MRLHENDSNTKRNWLEHLRNNSWEMELLITGFVLFGLFQIPDLLINLKTFVGLQIISSFARNSIGVIWRMLDTSVKVVILNLILLLILRGYWIGLIGLDSSIHSRKDRKRERKLLRNIRKLDDTCSIIFALTFLIVFVTISTGIYMITWSFITVIAGKSVPSFMLIPYRVLVLVILLIYTAVGILKLIDFLSVGVISGIKAKWFARSYNLLSRWVGFITLGFLSHRIYSAIIRTLSRKRFLMIFALYIVVIIVIFAGIRMDKRVFFPLSGSNLVINPNEYEDMTLHDPTDRGTNDGKSPTWIMPTIQSELITDSYLRLYIPYEMEDNICIQDSIDSIEPLHDELFMEYINFGGHTDVASQEQILEYYQNQYKITIDDSLQCTYKFRFYQHPNERDLGVLTYIPLGNLPNGLHDLILERKDRQYRQIIPFWLMREDRD